MAGQVYKDHQPPMRSYQCVACGHQFATVEILDTDYRRLLVKSALGEVLQTLERSAGRGPERSVKKGPGRNEGKAHRRPRRAVGEQNQSAKLTAAQVREIRELYATGRYSQRALAQQFGVGQNCVCDVVNRKTWRHIP